MSTRLDFDDGSKRRTPVALVLAAVVGAVFGALATGIVGVGLGVFSSNAAGAVSGGAMIGAAFIFAVCLIWNLEIRARGQRLNRVLEVELADDLQEDQAALRRLDSLLLLARREAALRRSIQAGATDPDHPDLPPLDRNELVRELESCRQAIEEIDERRKRLEARRLSAGAKLRVPMGKLVRDVIGASAGIALAPPTSGLSLSCSLIVDGLDISSDVADLYGVAIEARQLRFRRQSTMLRVDQIERILRGAD